MVEKRNKKLLNEINEAKERIIYLKNAIKFDTNRAEDEKQYWIENNKGRKFEDAKMHELHDYGNLISKVKRHKEDIEDLERYLTITTTGEYNAASFVKKLNDSKLYVLPFVGSSKGGKKTIYGNTSKIFFDEPSYMHEMPGFDAKDNVSTLYTKKRPYYMTLKTIKILNKLKTHLDSIPEYKERLKVDDFGRGISYDDLNKIIKAGNDGKIDSCAGFYLKKIFDDVLWYMGMEHRNNDTKDYFSFLNIKKITEENVKYLLINNNETANFSKILTFADNMKDNPTKYNSDECLKELREIFKNTDYRHYVIGINDKDEIVFHSKQYITPRFRKDTKVKPRNLPSHLRDVNDKKKDDNYDELKKVFEKLDGKFEGSDMMYYHDMIKNYDMLKKLSGVNFSIRTYYEIYKKYNLQNKVIGKDKAIEILHEAMDEKEKEEELTDNERNEKYGDNYQVISKKRMKKKALENPISKESLNLVGKKKEIKN